MADPVPIDPKNLPRLEDLEPLSEDDEDFVPEDDGTPFGNPESSE